MTRLRHGSLFSGLGGFDLAAQWMGWENVFHCENNPFCQKILKYYWSNAKTYGDIKLSDFTIYRGLIDVLSGGFPCQPYSTAGLRLGTKDHRHLWPEMRRAIREIQPTWVVGENVRGLVSWNGGVVFEEVQADMEAEGYEVIPFLLPACGIEAPHRRERIWFVAYSNRRWQSTQSNNGNKGCGQLGIATYRNSVCRQHANARENRSEKIQGEIIPKEWERIRIATGSCNEEHITDAAEQRPQGGFGLQESIRLNDRGSETSCGCDSSDTAVGVGCQRRVYADGLKSSERYLGSFDARNVGSTWENFPTQFPICSGDDGLSSELDGITFSQHRIKSIQGYGNAVVPQLVYRIFQSIQLTNDTIQNN